ncbi:MAG: hypothetical protein QW040_02360 [Candidatus Aenigmatarchaeota archaeon]
MGWIKSLKLRLSDTVASLYGKKEEKGLDVKKYTLDRGAFKNPASSFLYTIGSLGVLVGAIAAAPFTIAIGAFSIGCGLVAGAYLAWEIPREQEFYKEVEKYLKKT